MIQSIQKAKGSEPFWSEGAVTVTKQIPRGIYYNIYYIIIIRADKEGLMGWVEELQ